MGWTTGGSIPDWGSDGFLSLRRRVQTGTESHPASYPMSTGGYLPEGKATGPWSWPFSSI